MLNSEVIMSGMGNLVLIEKGCFIKGLSIRISGNNHKVIFKSGMNIIEGGRIIIEDCSNSLIIGERSKIYSCFLSLRDSNTEMKIGRDCLFSANVTIRTSDAHSIVDNAGVRINNGKSVYIGDHVWIGYNATILKGCEIGNDAIVGTNSVIGNYKVPEKSVVAGNPAKLIRSGVTWDINRV